MAWMDTSTALKAEGPIDFKVVARHGVLLQAKLAESSKLRERENSVLGMEQQERVVIVADANLRNEPRSHE